MTNLKQSASEAALIVPRLFWILTVVGVALVAGEPRAGIGHSSMPMHAEVMDATVHNHADAGVLEP